MLRPPFVARWGPRPPRTPDSLTRQAWLPKKHLAKPGFVREARSLSLARSKITLRLDPEGVKRQCAASAFAPQRSTLRRDKYDRLMPPQVSFHVFGILRDYCGGASEISIAAGTVREALAYLEQHQPALYRNICDETGAVRRHLNVFVNEDNVRFLKGVDTPLAEGDIVTALPAVSGG